MTTELSTVTSPTATATAVALPAQQQGGGFAISVFGTIQGFEEAQRIARALSSSNMVPQQYQGNIPNCLIAMEVANRIGINVMAVMQGLNVIHGRPSWSAAFVSGAIASCGLFTPLRFEWRGAEGSDDWGCRAFALDLRGGRERLDGPWVTVRMAKAEGWWARERSKWPTMTEVMLTARAITFFGRRYASHVLNGMPQADEVIDTGGAGDGGPVQLVQEVPSVSAAALTDAALAAAPAPAAGRRARRGADAAPAVQAAAETAAAVVVGPAAAGPAAAVVDASMPPGAVAAPPPPAGAGEDDENALF